MYKNKEKATKSQIAICSCDILQFRSKIAV